MSQQLNLLPKNTDDRRPAKLALFVLGVVCLILFATWGVKRGALVSARADEAASAAQLAQVTAQLQERVQTRSAELNAEIDALRSRAEAAKQVLNLAAAMGKPQGYSPFFSSLATIKEEGLWLNEAIVGKGGTSLQINGQSLDKDAVIRYSERLNSVFADSGIKFTNLELTPTSSVGADGKTSQLTVVKFSLR